VCALIAGKAHDAQPARDVRLMPSESWLNLPGQKRNAYKQRTTECYCGKLNIGVYTGKSIQQQYMIKCPFEGWFATDIIGFLKLSRMGINIKNDSSR
jgi:hypothetical protein